MLNFIKKAVRFIASFIFDVIKLFVWIPLFIFVAFVNVKFFLKEKGENNGESAQKSSSYQ
ncbi:MAG: hypothetical protein UT90_C0015G0010 [Parcubacteria group bacterium GW2011_GWA1_40_21]|nr:MAG: hypothetical protein UT80_C0027G0008 [Parcubacteria group bacterium GW2011_GWC1_40_13]KKR53073.1 MAG: hypothetical protein UT90_C0015G0010 [Parcubacteria group bacterium GW2011_GWA1_40_21]